MATLNQIVLVEPEIPYNTGNIARTCVITGCELHLVKPLGFEISDKYLKRAGLDYWQDVDLQIWENLACFQEYMEVEAAAGRQIIYATTKGKQHIGHLRVNGPTMTLFGKETAGLPETLLHAHPERCWRIPMSGSYRSLNLSNSEAIILYEILRQQGYPGLH